MIFKHSDVVRVNQARRRRLEHMRLNGLEQDLRLTAFDGRWCRGLDRQRRPRQNRRLRGKRDCGRLEWNGLGVLGKRFHIGACLIQHRLDGSLWNEDVGGLIRGRRRGQCRGGRSRRGRVCLEQRGGIRLSGNLTERGLDLRRQDEELSSRLHDHLAHIAPGRGDDFHGLALCRATHFVAQPCELVRLRDPRVAAHAVLFNQVGNLRAPALRSALNAFTPRRSRIVLLGHLSCVGRSKDLVGRSRAHLSGRPTTKRVLSPPAPSKSRGKCRLSVHTPAGPNASTSELDGHGRFRAERAVTRRQSP